MQFNLGRESVLEGRAMRVCLVQSSSGWFVARGSTCIFDRIENGLFSERYESGGLNTMNTS
jgi:hypothetical protein